MHRAGEWLFRGIAFLAGVGVMAAVTHNMIVDGVGYSSPRASVYLTIAGVVMVAAVGIGYALSRGWRLKAAGLIAGIIAFECAGLVFTAERVIADRDAKQQPARQATQQRLDAQKRIDELQTKLASMTTTIRLQSALAAHTRAIDDASAKSALRGCASNCRKLLEAARDQAVTEVRASRQELTERRGRIAEQLQLARTQLATIQTPSSGSPLADRLGWQPWVIDLIVAGLYSMAGNVTACILIAMGAHSSAAMVERGDRSRHSDRIIKQQVDIAENDQAEAARLITALPAPDIAAQGLVEAFASQHLQRSDGDKVRVSEALDHYRGWCHAIEVDPVASDEFVRQMASLTRRDRLMVALEDRDAVIHGVKLEVAA